MTGAEFGGVDIDLLADYIGGALEGTPEESAVAARITDDPAWQAAYESLGGGMALVGAELGRLGPEPMPADLAARLDEMFRTATPTAETTPHLDAAPALNAAPALDTTPTLNTAPALDTAPTLDTAPGPDATSTGLDTPSGPDTASTGLDEPVDGDRADVADPAPITGDLAAPPVPHLAAVRGPSASGDGAPAVREKQRDRRLSRRRMKWATPIAIAAGVVAFAGFSLDYLAGRDTDGARNTAADSAAGGAVVEQAAPLSGAATFASGTNYTRATLAVEPVGVLTAPAPAAGSTGEKDASGRAVAGKEGGLARLTQQPALETCLAEIERENAGGVISVQSVDYARFEGKPALVVRFSAANGQWAWASGPACGTPEGGAATLGNAPVR